VPRPLRGCSRREEGGPENVVGHAAARRAVCRPALADSPVGRCRARPHRSRPSRLPGFHRLADLAQPGRTAGMGTAHRRPLLGHPAVHPRRVGPRRCGNQPLGAGLHCAPSRPPPDPRGHGPLRLGVVELSSRDAVGGIRTLRHWDCSIREQHRCPGHRWTVRLLGVRGWAGLALPGRHVWTTAAEYHHPGCDRAGRLAVGPLGLLDRSPPRGRSPHSGRLTKGKAFHQDPGASLIPKLPQVPRAMRSASPG